MTGEMVPHEQEISIQAPAKVNLCIRVLDTLPNGYHEIWSLMHTVDLFDQLDMRLNPLHQDIQLTCDHTHLPVDRRNLVYRAAENMLRRSEQTIGVEIALKKVIPLAAGLGGGSSDAAAVIFGLNHLLKLHWSHKELCEVGAELGSDIPFFFRAPSAIVQGWGQTVAPCQVAGKRWAVLVNPRFPIQTQWAYEQLSSNRQKVLSLNPSTQEVEARLEVSWEEVIGMMENDFELPLFSFYPILEFVKEKLCTLGAQSALLSGSGATVFGIFDDPDVARSAAIQLRQDTQWHVFDVPMGTTTLPHHVILDNISPVI